MWSRQAYDAVDFAMSRRIAGAVGAGIALLIGRREHGPWGIATLEEGLGARDTLAAADGALVAAKRRSARRSEQEDLI